MDWFVDAVRRMDRLSAVLVVVALLAGAAFLVTGVLLPPTASIPEERGTEDPNPKRDT
jgi:hypothetical protein